MAKKIFQSSPEEIIQSIERREFVPVYLLMGEEPYYIDKIADAIDQNVLTEDEKGFNQMTIYCTKDTDVMEIVNVAKRYPMMSEHQVVFVKEAQNLKHFEHLIHYVENPLLSTILVICYKHGKVDKRLKVTSTIERVGLVYESPKLKDAALPNFVDEYLKGKGLKIEQSAKMVLVEHIGADLSRMTGELDKLVITMPAGEKTITTDLIERNIGISKEYNVWELKTALIQKDVLKANRIISYFNDYPKAGPPVVVGSTLFGFFAGVMQAWYAPSKSDQGLMDQLDLKSDWFLKEYKMAMRNYSAMKTMQIIGKLRETDAMLKGIKKGNTPDGDIMRELIYFILH